MKKALIIALLAVSTLALTGCWSLRTPSKGENHNKVYYSTFFGLSIESGCWGDGFIVK